MRQPSRGSLQLRGVRPLVRTGQICSLGICSCPSAAHSICNGVCADTWSDPLNCGTCGIACAQGQVAMGTACAPPAVSTVRARANGSCTNLQSDLSNCGGCGQTCGAGQICSLGICSCPLVARSSATACARIPGPIPLNCGTCGHACGHGQVCNGDGLCATNCVDGWRPRATEAVSTCRVTQITAGRAGRTCGVDQLCSLGQCSCPSAEPFVCNGVCADTKSDPLKLRDVRACVRAGAGVQRGWRVRHQLAWTVRPRCNGSCTDLQSDTSNCAMLRPHVRRGQVCSLGI